MIKVKTIKSYTIAIIIGVLGGVSISLGMPYIIVFTPIMVIYIMNNIYQAYKNRKVIKKIKRELSHEMSLKKFRILYNFP